jgi:hypothetical protein
MFAMSEPLAEARVRSVDLLASSLSHAPLKNHVVADVSIALSPAASEMDSSPGASPRSGILVLPALNERQA